jgi:hypothetical protein
MPKKKDPIRVRAGRRSKKKGDQFERDVANTLQKRYGTPGAPLGSREFYRTPLSGGMRREYPGDIVVPEWFPFMLECKSSQRSNPHFTDLNLLPLQGAQHQLIKWWGSELVKAQTIGRTLLIVFAQDRGPVLCLLSGRLGLNFNGLQPYLEVHAGEHRLVCLLFSALLQTLQRIDLDGILQRLRQTPGVPVGPASPTPESVRPATAAE